MTTEVKTPYIRTPSGEILHIAPGTEHPVSAAEVRRRRDAWYAQNSKYFAGYSVEQFLKEKHKDVESGLE